MADVEKAVVKTYVPVDQKAIWNEHASSLDMSQSEFVRTMVQAGRRGFDPDEQPDSSGATPGGDDLGTRLLDVLDEGEGHTWDRLRREMVANLDERLEATLQRLQSEGRVAYNGRAGGYESVDE